MQTVFLNMNIDQPNLIIIQLFRIVIINYWDNHEKIEIEYHSIAEIFI